MRNPHAVWRPLGRQTEPRMTAHDIVCGHTMVNSLRGADRYFRTLNGPGFDGTESHYGVGGAWDDDAAGGPGGSSLDGVAWQWQDRLHQADANGDGNPRVISIETADNAPLRASEIQPWTARQVVKLVEIIAWECSPAAHTDCPPSWACRRGVTWRGIRVAIPPVLIPDTRPDRRGLAVHRQGVLHSRGYGVDGYLARGGERWSIATGKECPGDARVRQFTRDVIPAVQARMLAAAATAKPPTPPTTPTAPTEEDEMKATDQIRLGPGSSTVLGQDDGVITYEESIAVRTAAAVQTNQLLQQVLAGQAEIRTQLAELRAARSGPATGG